MTLGQCVGMVNCLAVVFAVMAMAVSFLAHLAYERRPTVDLQSLRNNTGIVSLEVLAALVIVDFLLVICRVVTFADIVYGIKEVFGR